MKSSLSVIGQSGSVGVTLTEKIKQHPVFREGCYDHGVESWRDLSLDTLAYKNKILEIARNTEIIVLCVADEIAKYIVSLLAEEGGDTKIIDCSTAYRVDPDWAYGLPELGPDQASIIQQAQKVANPGCHASASLLSLAPLKEMGRIQGIVCHSSTGYSGGGKSMIEEYQKGKSDPVAAYSVGKPHKHVAEIQHYSGQEVFFQPVVTNVYQGILSSTYIPGIEAKDLLSLYKDFYAEQPFVSVNQRDGSIGMTENHDSNHVSLSVQACDFGTQVIAVLDNLGKGSAGAVIQNANLMLGHEQNLGL